MANIHIEDSYKVSKNSFNTILATFVDSDSLSVKAHRSPFSLRSEWAVHNFLYSLGLWRGKTKDVDLNYPNKWEWLYCIIGALVWLFIK